ncbi:YraN family protein [Polaromonas glacialis]|uniref:YraN family protein n=1 Tax=Polaromonas glacialis TaxID=866564 RepID=UPI0004954054|nr:YraN family protein [Polaromonas glacialis]
MWFSRKQADQLPTQCAAASAAPAPTQVTTKSRGDAAEAAAKAWLARAGLRWIESNYRTPGRGGGEIDLVMRAPDGTLVFVEVRQRASASHGGAAASISGVKQRRIIFAARHYLLRFASPPPCRFDVVLVHGTLGGGDGPGPDIEWLPAAFDAS